MHKFKLKYGKKEKEKKEKRNKEYFDPLLILYVCPLTKILSFYTFIVGLF